MRRHWTTRPVCISLDPPCRRASPPGQGSSLILRQAQDVDRSVQVRTCRDFPAPRRPGHGVRSKPHPPHDWACGAIRADGPAASVRGAHAAGVSALRARPHHCSCFVFLRVRDAPANARDAAPDAAGHPARGLSLRAGDADGPHRADRQASAAAEPAREAGETAD